MREKYGIVTEDVMCQCRNEILTISTDVAEPDGTITLMMYEIGSHVDSRITFWDRFRWIINFLKNGRPFLDQIVLEREEAERLVGTINQMLLKTKFEQKNND